MAIASTAPAAAESPWERASREFHCDHPRTVLAVKIASNGARNYRDQCRRCGASVRPVPRAEVGGRQAVPFDEGLAQRWSDARRARWEELYRQDQERQEQDREREKREFDVWYAAYLQSPEWRRKRALVLRRADGICEGCLERPATQVHHLTYAHVGHELLFELRAICDACHRVAHPEKHQ